MTAALVALGCGFDRRALQRQVYRQAVDMALMDPAAIDAFGAACARNLAAHHLDAIGLPRW